MLVTKTIEFDMGHRLPNHAGRCKNIHGHRYKLEIGVEGEIVTNKDAFNEGMVIDFGLLKSIVNEVIVSHYDHSLVLYYKDKYCDKIMEMTEEDHLLVHPVTYIPTVENLAMNWFRELNEFYIKENIKLKYLKIWETPTSVAIYTDIDDSKFRDKGQKKLFWKEK